MYMRSKIKFSGGAGEVTSSHIDSILFEWHIRV